jgi:cytochrome b561
MVHMLLALWPFRDPVVSVNYLECFNIHSSSGKLVVMLDFTKVLTSLCNQLVRGVDEGMRCVRIAHRHVTLLSMIWILLFTGWPSPMKFGVQCA